MNTEPFEDPKVVEALGALRDPAMPPGAWARLKVALGRPAPSLWRWGAAAAPAAAVVVSLGVLRGGAGPELIKVEVRDVAAGPDLDEWSAYVGQYADAGGVPVAPPTLTALPPEVDRP